MTTQRREAIVAVVLLTAIAAAIQGFLYLSPVQTAKNVELDLAGEWQLCVPKDPAQPCDWTAAKVPADLPKNLRADFNGWILYKKKFTAPESCRAEGAACSLFFGEVGDAVEAKLNGVSLGRRGDFPPAALYAKHYPARFDLSRDLLKPGENANELSLTVYSLKHVQSGVRRGPAAIFSNLEGVRMSQSFVTLTVVVPIVGAVGLFLMGVFAWLAGFATKGQDSRLNTYVGFCAGNAFFLVSFSEIPREYLPIGLAGTLHFLSRLLSDWAYFEMIRDRFDYGPWVKKVFRPLYALAVAALSVTFLFGGVAKGFDSAYLICRIAVPLIILPHVLGMLGAWRARKTAPAPAFFAPFFALMLFFQLRDNLIFHGFMSGAYAVKVYPFFIALALGWLIWKERQKEKESLLVAREQAEHAAQVAHDIGSPLAALNSAMPELSALPEETRLILRTAVGRIQAIAGDLLDQRRRLIQNTQADQKLDPRETVLLWSLIDSIVAEKRLEYRSRLGIEIRAKLDAQAYGRFAKVEPNELRRLLSNLINNGVEALTAGGVIELSLAGDGTQTLIRVADTGQGIPPEILEKLGQRGKTFGKAKGSGLGLAHAKETLEAWGGSLKLISEPGKGTVVEAALPAAPAPDWFLGEIAVTPGMTVVVVDDDPSVHRIWQNRLESLAQPPKILNFWSDRELKDWAQAHPTNNTLILADYELRGSNADGLGLVKELGLCSRSVLVTSRYEDPAIIKGCLSGGMRMIPKAMAGFVPITTPQDRPDAVLIDDDELTRKVWSLSARQSGKRLLAFPDGAQFLAQAQTLCPDTAVYIDSMLGEAQGEALAKRLHELGFKKIRITTGRAKQEIAPAPWIADVVDKTPPWD